MIDPALDATQLRPGGSSTGAEDSDPTRLSRGGDLTPSESSGERHPLDHLAEEFAERCRRGESPSIAEYEARLPEQAEQIRRLLGAVAMMEQLRRGSKQARHLPERIGEFRILRELGRGGMGVVYEAVQESLWRHVAVKAIHHTQLDLKRLQRFQREAQAVAQLHHTNIVPIFGVGEHDGVPYYAMQYIRGQGLDARLDSWRRDGLLPSRERWRIAARYVAQTAEALGYAHEQGVLHRDIKPANLLIDEHDAVWVTDFGLAKMVGHDELTATGDVIGTLRYLAPESLRGQSETRSDVYSLGLTLYELLTLQPPFGDLSPSELLHRVNEGRPVRPRLVDRTIPRDLETIVLKATAREPKDRYRTAQDLGRDLERFLEDRPIRARRATEIERAWRWSRRNRGTAALIALLAASVVLAAVLGWAGYVAQTRALAAETGNLRETNELVDLISQTLLKLFLEIAPAETPTDEDAIQLVPTEEGPGINRRRDFAGGPPNDFGGPRDFGGGPPNEFGGPRGPGGPPDFGGPHAAHARGAGRFGAPKSGRLEGPGDPGRFGPGGSGPGDSATQEQTLVSLRALLGAYDQFANRNRTNPLVQSQAAWVYFTAGQLHQRLGQRDEADHDLGRALQIFQGLASRFPQHSEYFGQFVTICTQTNPWQVRSPALGAVADRLDQMDAILRMLIQANPTEIRYTRARMQGLAKAALVRSILGRDGVDSHFAEALRIADTLVAGRPTEPTPHTDRAEVHEAYGLVLDARHQAKEARQHFEAAFEDLEWVAFDGTRSLTLATRMEGLADRFEVLLGDKARGDEIQVRADRIDPRPPLANRPKAGRPFEQFQADPAVPSEPTDRP